MKCSFLWWRQSAISTLKALMDKDYSLLTGKIGLIIRDWKRRPLFEFRWQVFLSMFLRGVGDCVLTASNNKEDWSNWSILNFPFEFIFYLILHAQTIVIIDCSYAYLISASALRGASGQRMVIALMLCHYVCYYVMLCYFLLFFVILLSLCYSLHQLPYFFYRQVASDIPDIPLPDNLY